MAFCKKCGNSLEDGQQFCPKCGEAVQPAAAAAAPVAPVAPVVTAPVAPPAPYAPAAAPVQASRKSRKGLWIALAALVVLIAVACVLVFAVFQDQIFGGLTPQEEMVQTMNKAMEDKDLDALMALVDPQGLQTLEDMGVMTADEFRGLLDEEMQAYDSMKFSGVKMETKVAQDGQTAVVTIVEGKVTTVANGQSTVEDVKDAAEPEVTYVVLRDGKWYLDILASMQ